MSKIILAIFTFFICSCNGDRNDNSSTFLEVSPRSIEDRATTLFQIETVGSFVLSEEVEKRFFQALPSSFDEFKTLYGKKYQTKDGRILYLSYSYHFNVLLPNLYYTNKKAVIDKLIKISMDAQFVYDSLAVNDDISALSNLQDAISLFQRCVQLEIAKEVKLASDGLHSFSQNEIASFWKFYFNGPHPSNYLSDFRELYIRFLKLNKNIAELMNDSYENIQKDEKH